MAEAYIVAAARTAGGRKGGRLAGWHPADLAAAVLDTLIERSGAAPDQVEDVIMGCVMQAGEQSNNIARNAIMASKLPDSVPGTSIDRQCGSSQQSIHFAAQGVMAGAYDLVKLTYYITYVLDRISIVEIRIERQDNVAMIFEVVNDRGLGLKPYEILKGKLIGTLPAGQKEKANKVGRSCRNNTSR